jgi:hypothetical protein
MEKRDCHVFEDVFHAAVDKAQLLAGSTKKLFKNPLRIIDASVISLCLAAYGWAAYRKAPVRFTMFMVWPGCAANRGLSRTRGPNVLDWGMVIINPYTV